MNAIKERIRKYAKALSLLLFMMTTVNLAPDTSFNEWDKDGSDRVSIDEFQSRFIENYYSDWNVNDDEYLDDEDFYLMTFRILDTNDDEMLAPSEAKWGYDYLYGDYVDYEVTVREDSEEEMDFENFYDLVYDTDYFSDYDADSDTYLSEAELANSIFETWDIDGNGYLSRNEFNTFHELFLET